VVSLADALAVLTLPEQPVVPTQRLPMTVLSTMAPPTMALPMTARLFHGSDEDAFLLAVEATVTHGLHCRSLTGSPRAGGLSCHIRSGPTGRSPS